MTRKHSHSNASKDRSRRKHDVWTAALTILGLIIAQITLVIHADNANPIKAYLYSQASAGSFYINILAVLSTAYGKASARFHVNGVTYLLSMLGYVLVAHIFAQAIFMVYPNIHLYAEFMRSEWFSIIGHMLLFGVIILLACSKGVPDYKKETIKRK